MIEDQKWSNTHLINQLKKYAFQEILKVVLIREIRAKDKVQKVLALGSQDNLNICLKVIGQRQFSGKVWVTRSRSLKRKKCQDDKNVNN